jgi:hypothetical protein
MKKVQNLKNSNTAPLSKTFRDGLNTYFVTNPFRVLPFRHTHTCSSAPATVGNISGNLLLESSADGVSRRGDVIHQTF